MTAPTPLTPQQLDELQEHRDRLAIRLNKMINHFAGREDLLLECIWSRTSGQPNAPAWFTPDTGWVTIDATFALQGADPGHVNPLTVKGRREHPVIIGLCCHEASHAHSTRWPKDLSENGIPAGVMNAAILLEEPRIERRQIERRPSDRPYLRAQSILIDLKQFADTEDVTLDRWRAANAALMVLARVDAGVLEVADAETVEPILRERLGDDLDALQEIWREALTVEDGDFDALIAVATKWVEVLGEPPQEGLTLPGCAAGVTGEPVPGESEWDEGTEPEDGEEQEPSEMGELAEAMSQMAAQAMAEASEELDADAAAEVPSAADQDRLNKAEQEAKDRKKQKKSVQRGELVFSAEPGHRVRFRDPTEKEQMLSRQIGTVLRHASFRERTLTKVRSVTPPGRLDSREALVGSAQKAMGMPITAQPFRDKRYRRSPEPPITLGIMSDTSGSMGWAQELMATLTWSFAHALTYVQGRAASVLYGSGRVTALAKPGVPPKSVAEFLCTGGGEVFGQAFEALDGALNLTMGRGVRMLVVISDGDYTDNEHRAARDGVSRVVRNGGVVLWVTDNVQSSYIPEGAIPVEVDRGGQRVPGLPLGADTVPSAMVTALAIALNS